MPACEVLNMLSRYYTRASEVAKERNEKRISTATLNYLLALT